MNLQIFRQKCCRGWERSAAKPNMDSAAALRRLAIEARKPKHCEGVRVLGPVSESDPLTYRVEIVGP